jgi:hypothetical protein
MLTQVKKSASAGGEIGDAVEVVRHDGRTGASRSFWRFVAARAGKALSPRRLCPATDFALFGDYMARMSREDEDVIARRAELAKLFQKKPSAAVTKPVKVQPPDPTPAELSATARAAKLQRSEKANSIRMKRLHR